MQTVHVTATKQLFVNKHINCCGQEAIFFNHFTSYQDSVLYIYAFCCVVVTFRETRSGFLVDVTHYNFSHLK